MLESDIYKKVANDLEIDLFKVEEYNNRFWGQVKYDLNNPDQDVLEIQDFGTFTITSAKLSRTLKYSIKMLRKLKASVNKRFSQKGYNSMLSYTNLLSRLWKLKQEIQ